MENTNKPNTFEVGQDVFFNGDYKGTVVEVHTGVLVGMYSVRNEYGRGTACISGSEVRAR